MKKSLILLITLFVSSGATFAQTDREALTSKCLEDWSNRAAKFQSSRGNLYKAVMITETDPKRSLKYYGRAIERANRYDDLYKIFIECNEVITIKTEHILDLEKRAEQVIKRASCGRGLSKNLIKFKKIEAQIEEFNRLIQEDTTLSLEKAKFLKNNLEFMVKDLELHVFHNYSCQGEEDIIDYAKNYAKKLQKQLGYFGQF